MTPVACVDTHRLGPLPARTSSAPRREPRPTETTDLRSAERGTLSAVPGIPAPGRQQGRASSRLAGGRDALS